MALLVGGDWTRAGECRRTAALTLSCDRLTSFNQLASFSQATPAAGRIRRLVLSHTVLDGAHWSAAVFPALNRLELRSVDAIGYGFLASIPSSVRVMVAGENSINCSRSLLKLPRNWHWNWNGLLCWPLKVVNVSHYLDVLRRVEHVECPPACRCSVLDNLLDGGDQAMPQVYVDCTRLAEPLHALPSVLPSKEVVFLDMRGNQVDDLTPLVTRSELYRRVHYLDLRANRIDSIDVLRHSDWLERFRYLNVAGNRLRRADWPMFDEASRRRDDPSRSVLVLAENPWTCDCATVQNLQVLMIKDVYDLGDRNEVRCGGGGPAAVSGRPILSLAPGLVCPDAGGAWLRLALRCAAVAFLAAAVASAVASAVELAALHRRAALTVFAALLDRVPS